MPGGQAEYLRVRRADANAVKVGHELPDERYLFLSDIRPTAWQGVKYAGLPPQGTLGVIGLGPVGQFAVRAARHLGHRVLAVDPVVERRELAERYGGLTLDSDGEVLEALEALREGTYGRGPDAVVDAVGMEAHGDGAVLDKQLTAVRMGQCNVQHWIADLLPLVEDPDDPLGTMDLVTHRVPLEEAPRVYDVFQRKAGRRLHQGRAEAGEVMSCQIPEDPRRWEPTRWVSMMPMASISANNVVGPTKTNPCLRSAFASATDSGERPGISVSVRGSGVWSGRKDQTNGPRPPLSRSRIVARALVIVALIFARFRTIPASPISCSTRVSS